MESLFIQLSDDVQINVGCRVTYFCPLCYFEHQCIMLAC